MIPGNFHIRTFRALIFVWGSAGAAEHSSQGHSMDLWQETVNDREGQTAWTADEMAILARLARLAILAILAKLAIQAILARLPETDQKFSHTLYWPLALTNTAKYPRVEHISWSGFQVWMTDSESGCRADSTNSSTLSFDPRLALLGCKELLTSHSNVVFSW